MTPSAPLHRPTAELVAQAWLRTVPEIVAASVGIATTRPDRARWTSPPLFVTVGSSLGGIPHAYLPIREPVLQINVWAQSTGASKKPPWNMAAVMADDIYYYAYSSSSHGTFEMPVPNYDSAYLGSVECRREPGRVPEEDESLAHYSFDLAFTFHPTNLIVQ